MAGPFLVLNGKEETHPRVLVVDDLPQNVRLMEAILTA